MLMEQAPNLRQLLLLQVEKVVPLLLMVMQEVRAEGQENFLLAVAVLELLDKGLMAALLAHLRITAAAAVVQVK